MVDVTSSVCRWTRINMKIVWNGKESQGKSLMLSKKADEIMRRNAKWVAMGLPPRTMVFNQPMSKEFENQVRKRGVGYLQIKNQSEFLFMEQIDLFLDEVIKYFPARGSEPLSMEQLHFLSQGAKSGIQIYGASQDFSQVHKQFRLLVNEVYVVKKIIGSHRPMKTAPPVKRIWGMCYARQVKPESFRGDSVTMETKGFPSFFFIDREDCERFDTEYKIPQSELPLKKLRKQRERFDGDEETQAFEKVKFV